MAYQHDDMNPGMGREDSWHRRRARQQAQRRRKLTFAAILAVSLLVLTIAIIDYLEGNSQAGLFDG